MDDETQCIEFCGRLRDSMTRRDMRAVRRVLLKLPRLIEDPVHHRVTLLCETVGAVLPLLVEWSDAVSIVRAAQRIGTLHLQGATPHVAALYEGFIAHAAVLGSRIEAWPPIGEGMEHTIAYLQHFHRVSSAPTVDKVLASLTPITDTRDRGWWVSMARYGDTDILCILQALLAMETKRPLHESRQEGLYNTAVVIARTESMREMLRDSCDPSKLIQAHRFETLMWLMEQPWFNTEEVKFVFERPMGQTVLHGKRARLLQCLKAPTSVVRRAQRAMRMSDGEVDALHEQLAGDGIHDEGLDHLVDRARRTALFAKHVVRTQSPAKQQCTRPTHIATRTATRTATRIGAYGDHAVFRRVAMYL
jgi:hypothetical protein